MNSRFKAGDLVMYVRNDGNDIYYRDIGIIGKIGTITTAGIEASGYRLYCDVTYPHVRDNSGIVGIWETDLVLAKTQECANE
jgi:hypothetical protein